MHDKTNLQIDALLCEFPLLHSYLLWHLWANTGNISVCVKWDKIRDRCLLRKLRTLNGNLTRHLVNGESDGIEVGSHLAFFASILLHERHHESAGHLVVLWIIILLQQTKAVLRVGPESICKVFTIFYFSLISNSIFFSADPPCEKRHTWFYIL